MRTKPVGLLLVLVFVVAAAASAPAKEEGPKLPRWRKGEQKGTVEIDGQEEGWVALVPKGYTTRKTWPVVLLAHGNGGKAASFLRVVKPMAGKRPPLLISLERCDNNQDAVGYVPKYLEALKTQFSIDEDNVYALGFSGGGFRLWDDIVCKADVLPKFRGAILVGSAKQSFDPPQKPEKAATVILVGDPRDSNFRSREEAQTVLEEKGYEVIVHEHHAGHSMPRKEIGKVFEWIDKQIRASRKRRRR